MELGIYSIHQALKLYGNYSKINKIQQSLIQYSNSVTRKQKWHIDANTFKFL